MSFDARAMREAIAERKLDVAAMDDFDDIMAAWDELKDLEKALAEAATFAGDVAGSMVLRPFRGREVRK